MITLNLDVTKIRLKVSTYIRKYINSRFKAGIKSNRGSFTCYTRDLWVIS